MIRFVVTVYVADNHFSHGMTNSGIAMITKTIQIAGSAHFRESTGTNTDPTIAATSSSTTATILHSSTLMCVCMWRTITSSLLKSFFDKPMASFCQTTPQPSGNFLSPRSC